MMFFNRLIQKGFFPEENKRKKERKNFKVKGGKGKLIFVLWQITVREMAEAIKNSNDHSGLILPPPPDQ